MEIPGGRGLKSPRPKLGCSDIVEEEMKKKKKKKKKSLITKLSAITFQLLS